MTSPMPASNPRKAAGLTADQVPNLKLKWAFGFPGAEEVYGQPTVAGGRVFLGVDTGAVYSIDAETGCVYWSYQADAGVRTAISIGPVKGKGAAKYGVYFGDIRANVYMLDASTGKEIWKVKVEDHPVAKITGAPMLYEDRLYVPVSSQEERSAGWSTVYPCCTFRGSVVALDASERPHHLEDLSGSGSTETHDKKFQRRAAIWPEWRRGLEYAHD